MRSVDDIRQVLLDVEPLAPDGAGLIEAVRAGAARVRRRRRLMIASAVAVALVVPLALVAFSRVTGTAESAVTPASPPYRGALQATVDVDPNSGYTVLGRQFDRDSQLLTLRPPVGVNDIGVMVFNPAAFDSAPVRRGEPVPVAGRSARYVNDLDVSKYVCSGTTVVPAACQRSDAASLLRVPAIGWAEPTGAWVIVVSPWGSTRADLLAAAATVRLGPPRGIRVPYRLGYLPAGLTGISAMVTDSGPWQRGASLAFDPDPDAPVGGPNLGVPDALSGPVPALGISGSGATPYTTEKVGELGPPTKVAGLDTYYADRNVGVWRLQTGSAVFVVVSGACQFHFAVRDHTQIPRSELVRMVENATFTDCNNPATWITPLT